MIRSYTKADAERCSQIMRECLEMMEEYEPELKELLNEKRTPEWIDEQFCTYDRVLVYDREGIVLGFISLRKRTIEGLYVDPVYHHEDIGSSLLDELENYAVEKHLTSIRVESSFLAERFYQEAGYRTIAKGQVEMGDFMVLFIDMEKQLIF